MISCIFFSMQQKKQGIQLHTHMQNIHKRFLLFLIGCIGIRSLFVYLAKTQTKLLPLFGLLALIPAMGFLYIYATGSRKTGPEVFNDPKGIWWNDLRPMHGLLYLSFAICAIQQKPYSWVFLLIDVLLGLSAFLIHHILQSTS